MYKNFYVRYFCDKRYRPKLDQKEASIEQAIKNILDLDCIGFVDSLSDLSKKLQEDIGIKINPSRRININNTIRSKWDIFEEDCAKEKDGLSGKIFDEFLKNDLLFYEKVKRSKNVYRKSKKNK